MNNTLHILSLRNIGRARWDTAQKEWKIDNVEIQIITFVIGLGVMSTVMSKVDYDSPF